MLRAGLRFRFGLLLIALALAFFSPADAFRQLGLRQQQQRRQQRPRCSGAGGLRMATGKGQEDLASDFCLAVLGGGFCAIGCDRSLVCAVGRRDAQPELTSYEY